MLVVFLTGSVDRDRFYQVLESLVTEPVKPPADIRWQCLDDESEHTTWTSAWNHMIDDHNSLSPNWVLLGTVPE